VKIAVASGKGGTGKSTISINLARILSKNGKNVVLLDCDVEEPNCHIFLKPQITSIIEQHLDVPFINEEKCTGCGECSRFCEFNCLAVANKKVIVFSELCHSCGGCALICPENAISWQKRLTGTIEKGKSLNLDFYHGKLKVGEPMSPPLIKELKKTVDSELSKNYFQILDCPPGTSCPVVASVGDADFVVLVTEPTPFGLNDLKLAVDMIKELKKPFGIVINKSNENDALIEDYTREENISILAKLSDERKIAEAYSKGEIIIDILPEYENIFTELANFLTGDTVR